MISTETVVAILPSDGGCAFTMALPRGKEHDHVFMRSDSENASSFLSQLNGDYLMANWYKIVLAVVFVVCATGLIVGNIRYFVKKRKNKVK